jgi:hypothetical protein
MKNVFIIHGAYGYPNENWFGWMKNKINKLGYEVYVPQLPTPDGQSLDNWLKVFQEHEDKINSETIVIGHSTGPAFLMSLILKLNVKIRSAYFVSGYTGLLGRPEFKKFDELNKTIVNKKFDYKKIKSLIKNIHVFHSDNDPYVSLEKSIEFAKNLDVNITLVPNAGHFNSKAGYDKFEYLFEVVKKDLSD